MYFFTLIFFFCLLLSPFFFFLPRSTKKNTKKTILYAQIILFLYWNIVFWGVLYGYLPRSLTVFGTGDPESSIFMLYWIFTPLITLTLVLEVISSLRKKMYRDSR